MIVRVTCCWVTTGVQTDTQQPVQGSTAKLATMWQQLMVSTTCRGTQLYVVTVRVTGSTTCCMTVYLYGTWRGTQLYVVTVRVTGSITCCMTVYLYGTC